MHEVFGTVLWVVCIGGGIAAVIGLISTRRTWEDFGKNGLLMESEINRHHAHTGSAAALRERDEEIRQMLEARNARRARRGEPPVDIEEELAKLTAPRLDPELEAEIRQLVVARNYRRTRAGKPALDVDAEVEREIRQLADL